MGVEGFRGSICNKNKWRKCCHPVDLSKVSSLFIDFNGIIHNAKSKVYLLNDGKLSDKDQEELDKKRKNLMNKSKEFLEEQHISEVIKLLEKEIEKLNPTDNIIIAVDGVVNSAKMNQQKSRRFLGGVSNKKDQYFIFDGNSITPGTKFMVNLDSALEKWTENKGRHYAKKVIYSSHLSPGEGEHKIFDYIRKGDLIKGDGLNIIHGQDNDLIILSTVCDLKNMIMLDQDGKKDPIVVDELREIVIENMKFPGSNDKLTLQDFCVVSTLFGNDFLHKFPNVLRLHNAFEIVFRIYSFQKSHLTDKNNNIVWGNYMVFLSNYNKFKGKDHFYREYLNDTRIHEPYPEIEKAFVEEDGEIKLDRKKFKRLWYYKQFNPEMLQWDGKVVEKYSDKLIQEMCINYLQTVQWVQYYYTKGLNYISNYHYYHYIYNPLIDEIVTVLRLIIEKNKTNILRDVVYKTEEVKLNPIHQLISVLPYSSIDILPRGYKTIYNKYMNKLNPRSFVISMENAYKPHQKTAILPGVNLPYVNKILVDSNYKLSKNLKEKKDSVYFKKYQELMDPGQDVLIDYDSDEDKYAVSDKMLI